METKTITVQRTETIPFDFDLAMAISRGEKEGKIIFQVEGEEEDAIIVYVSNIDKNHLLLVVTQGKEERSGWFNKKGESIGFPDDKLYIKLKKTETFKDKDILVGDSGFIFMLDTNGQFKTSMHVGLYTDGELTFGGAARENDIEDFKRANTKESLEFMFALVKSKDNRAIKLLKELYGVEENIDFKPFDKVLIKYEEGVPFIIETPKGTKLRICFEETGMMDCKGCVFSSLDMKCWDMPCVSPEREDGLTGRFVEVKE